MLGTKLVNEVICNQVAWRPMASVLSKSYIYGHIFHIPFQICSLLFTVATLLSKYWGNKCSALSYE